MSLSSICKAPTVSSVFLNLLSLRYFGEGLNRKMSDWQTEKKYYLSLSLNDKRKVYKNKSYNDVSKIPTWSKYVESHNVLPAKIPLQDNFVIDQLKNIQLADKVSIFKGDITTLEVDAIVNAANSRLIAGGGVDGAIHRAAGASLQQECNTLAGCDVGKAKITGGYKLPSKYIIQTVGPQGEKTKLLSECYKNSLDVLKSNNLRTIAFPCISTGIYGYPNLPAAHVAATEVRKHLESNPDSFDRIIFCIFLEEDEKIYQGILQSYFPVK